MQFFRPCQFKLWLALLGGARARTGTIGVTIMKLKVVNNDFYGTVGGCASRHMVNVGEAGSATRGTLGRNTVSRVNARRDLRGTSVVVLSVCPRTIISCISECNRRVGGNTIIASISNVGETVYPRVAGLSRGFNFIFTNDRPVTNGRAGNFSISSTSLCGGTDCVVIPYGTSGDIMGVLSSFTGSVNFNAMGVAAPRRRSEVVTFASRLPRILTYSCILDPYYPGRGNFSTKDCQSISEITGVGSAL